MRKQALVAIAFATVLAQACAQGSNDGAILSAVPPEAGAHDAGGGGTPEAGPCGGTGEPCCGGNQCQGSLICISTGVCVDLTAHDAGAALPEATAGDDDASDPQEASVGCQGTGMLLCGGTCVDTTSDPLNCGACGHDCQGGACTQSLCPTTVVSAQFSPPGRMTIDSMNAYWTNIDGTVRQAPLSGTGTTTVLAQGLSPMGIAVDTQYVYVASQDGRVVRAPLDGSAADGGAALDVLASSQPVPYALTIDDSDVYWSNVATGAGNGSVMACAKTGCPSGPTTLASGIHVQYPYGIATTAGLVYWTSFNFGGELNTVSTTGGTMSTPGTNLGYPYEVAIAGTTILTVLYGQGGGVATLTTTGGGQPYHVAGGQSFPTEGTTDGVSAYWTLTIPSAQNGATLMKASLTSGLPPQVLATGVQPAGSVAVDGTWVYWLSNGGQVLKTAK